MERIFNIFVHFENEICSKLGYAVHENTLDDQSAIRFLQERVCSDCKISHIYELRTKFTKSEYLAKIRLGESHHLFESFLEYIGAGSTPLFVVTPVVDGQPTFNYSQEHNDRLDLDDARLRLGEEEKMADWLIKYTTEDGMDIPTLIHDDYFLAIKLTYNAGLHVSSMKLLLSCIDSIAYVEYGNDRSTPFIDWLNAYANLTPLQIEAAELWELRNGILHMSNISSKKVRTNKVRRISFQSGGSPDYAKSGDDGVFYFNFYGLILAFAEAVGRWIDTYNEDPAKFAKFVERYDETISDSRAAFKKLSDNCGPLTD